MSDGISLAKQLIGSALYIAVELVQDGKDLVFIFDAAELIFYFNE